MSPEAGPECSCLEFSSPCRKLSESKSVLESDGAVNMMHAMHMKHVMRIMPPLSFGLGKGVDTAGLFGGPGKRCSSFSGLRCERTLPETNTRPENGWLEDFFPSDMAYFQWPSWFQGGYPGFQ